MKDKQTWMFIFAQGKHNDLFTGIKKGSVNKNRVVVRVPGSCYWQNRSELSFGPNLRHPIQTLSHESDPPLIAFFNLSSFLNSILWSWRGVKSFTSFLCCSLFRAHEASVETCPSPAEQLLIRTKLFILSKALVSWAPALSLHSVLPSHSSSFWFPASGNPPVFKALAHSLPLFYICMNYVIPRRPIQHILHIRYD